MATILGPPWLLAVEDRTARPVCVCVPRVLVAYPLNGSMLPRCLSNGQGWSIADRFSSYYIKTSKAREALFKGNFTLQCHVYYAVLYLHLEASRTDCRPATDARSVAKATIVSSCLVEPVGK
jgi:hypothetical protein